MSEMRQRVVDAIKAEIGRQLGAKPLPGSRPEWGDWTAVGDLGSLDLGLIAAAAMKAMREPTEAMLAAGAMTRRDGFNTETIYRSMIDEALK